MADDLDGVSGGDADADADTGTDTGPRAAVIQLGRPSARRRPPGRGGRRAVPPKPGSPAAPPTTGAGSDAGPEPGPGAPSDPTDGGSPGDQDGGRTSHPAPSGATAVVVDDRMRRRRIAVLRAAGRRRLRRLAWLLVPVAVVADGAALAQTSLVNVDRILVEATEHTSAASIRWAAGIQPGDALATLDEHAAEDAVARLPWVDQADVVREWPGTVRIRVTERVPAAEVPGAEGVPPVLVDREGRVLDIGGPVPFGVMPITGVTPSLREGATLPASVMDALDLGVRLNERLPGVTVAVDVGMDATLSQGGIARFGSLEQVEDKLLTLEAFVADVDLSGLAVLDLRVPDNPTIRRQ